MLLKLFIYLATGALTYFACLYYRLQYDYTDFKAYLDLLVNVSGMVFTLMGLWIAVLYPNALSRLVQPGKVVVPDFSEAFRETRRLEALVIGVLQSGSVVLGILAISLLRIFIGHSQWYYLNRHQIKLAAFVTIVVLSILQIDAILQVLKANIFFLLDLHKLREEREVDNDI